MNFIVSAFCLLFALTAQAATKREINSLLIEAQDSLLNSNATANDLDEVARNLHNAIAIINSGGSGIGPNQECIDYAYEKYYITNTSTTAMDKAIVACRSVADVDVLKLAFEKYYITNTATTAMDKAATVADQANYGKLEIIEFAYSKYYITNTATTSMDKASTKSRGVRIGSEGCLRSAFDRYYITNTATTAMDKAFEACL